jgi:hypothetical protein
MLRSIFFLDKSRTPVSIRQQLATIIIMLTPAYHHSNRFFIFFFLYPWIAIGHQLFDYLPTTPETFPVSILIKLHTKKLIEQKRRKKRFYKIEAKYTVLCLLTRVYLPSIIHAFICLMPSSMSLSFRFTCIRTKINIGATDKWLDCQI